MEDNVPEVGINQQNVLQSNHSWLTNFIKDSLNWNRVPTIIFVQNGETLWLNLGGSLLAQIGIAPDDASLLPGGWGRKFNYLEAVSPEVILLNHNILGCF